MEFKKSTVEELIEQDIIEKPMDGNHGSIHPKTKDFIDVGIPFITAADIHSDKVDIEKANKLSEKDAHKLKKGFAKKGDVLLTHKASVGRTAIVNNMEYDYIILSPQVTYYRIKDTTTLLPEYLYLYFKSNYFNQIINQWAGGSTRKYIGITAQKKLPILYPSIKNQKKIVDFIMTFEYKVQVNNKIIANLEELSQTLFKRWFVDFEFPDENGNPYKSSGGEMVDSKLGKIPKYWKVSNLDKIASFVSRGITPKYNENSDIQIPIINQKVNKGPRLDLQYIKYFDGQNRIKKELYAQKNDLLLNSLGQGTLGRIHLFTRKSEEFLIDQHISIIRFDNINYSYFYYAHINTDLIQGQIDSLISGSTGMLMLNITKIRNLKVILPTEELVLKYSKLVNEYFGKITQLIYENENLTQLRDALLPKLMSGEIDIPDDIEVNSDELSI
ncbi:restriction endonuclease subunit S [Staphylococcus epidermidis]|uniref:restriction endonuclease subunit S n=1 Tax=Staphylococcus epidermidis TaxID=1282 RepID=UPI00142F9A32|nr:restriction endonuclease subunit S [Staphylococcus epidermidis]NJI62947.1 hypothetical protein [Staphylococcus epidermidis]